MKPDTLDKIVNLCPRFGRLMGIDVGSKTLGLALSDPDLNFATPLKTLKRTKFTVDIQSLEKIVRDYEVAGFVIGLPLNTDQSEGARAQSVRDFALELVRYPEIVGESPWIALWDERYSTHSAENLVAGHLNKRKAKDKGVTDALAAQIILQSALDYMNKSNA
jgi:putative Holliday junction resolvase